MRKLIIEIPDDVYEHAKNVSEDSYDEWDAMRAIAKGLPYEQRPHGEWIDESKDALKCSACGKWVYKPFIGGFPTERTQHYNPNYCAFCGADMREKGGDS